MRANHCSTCIRLLRKTSKTNTVKGCLIKSKKFVLLTYCIFHIRIFPNSNRTRLVIIAMCCCIFTDSYITINIRIAGTTCIICMGTFTNSNYTISLCLRTGTYSHTGAFASRVCCRCRVCCITTQQKTHSHSSYQSGFHCFRGSAFCLSFRHFRDDHMRMFHFTPDNSISPVHYNLPFSYRNYKIFYNFNYSPPTFSRHFLLILKQPGAALLRD